MHVVHLQNVPLSWPLVLLSCRSLVCNTVSNIFYVSLRITFVMLLSIYRVCHSADPWCCCPVGYWFVTAISRPQQWQTMLWARSRLGQTDWMSVCFGTPCSHVGGLLWWLSDDLVILGGLPLILVSANFVGLAFGIFAYILQIQKWAK